MGFFQSYCVSCHSPTGGDPGDKNFTQYASVVKYSAHIRCGVAQKHTQQPSWNCSESEEQFPIGTGPKPSGAERDRLVAWIDAGMPE
jgi:mono/diheme cytochrome c family protein